MDKVQEMAMVFIPIGVSNSGPREEVLVVSEAQCYCVSQWCKSHRWPTIIVFDKVGDPCFVRGLKVERSCELSNFKMQKGLFETIPNNRIWAYMMLSLGVSYRMLQIWEFNQVCGGRLKSWRGCLSSYFKFQGLWGALEVLRTRIFLKPPHHKIKLEELQPSTLRHVFPLEIPHHD